MFSTDRKIRRGVMALALFAAMGGTALAQTIVVRAGGPSAARYPAGKPVAGGSVTLAAGDTLTILDGKGTRTLRGPGTFSLAAASGAATNTSFTRLVSTQNKRRARTGAVRNVGGEAAPRPTNLWDVDTSRGGTFCAAASTAPRLWRADKERAAKLVLTDEAGRASDVNFAVGAQEAEWPMGAAKPAAGARYTLARADKGTSVRVTFAAIDADLANPAALAGALISQDCQAQYDLMITAIEADADKTGD
ncbi:hypothetical protein [Sphingomonas sp. C3-2]|uniref:hypothetical protein n=1 Tax=Sphingomonas sp. C3-2 TaxID=3062169 RepID=UPI00294AE056|nr:hypothetical protein [Sphingomonas sp. C3-2]WOK36558.1 hypothetical protein QYC26_16410 [Sphingomonas sp. C3-2]